ncbi:MlaA family lipoprotein [Chitinilyticum piscinae]|uniref:VacJ family lipoprotein n=1 Tax=Chitinilyticum piscinae TaxID=2866724 RepID=A0A8J7FY14_9NEIS|nr:VacJ family lipoprotein [Chitinilyticum piscinae]MBE9607763.1 VacJ family lipoprotein [Chitinilyticum piscinae]
MKRIVPLALSALLVACATPHNHYDPLEPVNRPIYEFNNAIDKAALKPLAQGWHDYVPHPVQYGVRNFFGNIDDLFGIPAALLQGKATPASRSFARVLVNTTAGLAGLIDVASTLPIEKQDEDLGQTLGYWGIPTGPYLMVPFYGPLTVRDSAEPISRFAWGPIDYIDPLGGQIAYYSTYLVSARADLLPLDAAIAEALDPYAFIRDAYLQRRWYKVHDGNPPHPLALSDDMDEQDEAPAQTETGNQPAQ